MPWHFMADKPQAWAAWLRNVHGYDVPDSVWDSAPGPGTSEGEAADPDAEAAGSPSPAFYKAEHSDTAFLVGKTIEYVETVAGRQPWAMHLSLLRPHPPWLAPAPYNTMYPPDALEPCRRGPGPEEEAAVHPYLGTIIGGRRPDESAERRGKAVYYGLCSEVSIGRYSHFDTTLYIALVILYTKYTWGVRMTLTSTPARRSTTSSGGSSRG
jgi:hypothetical protein